MYGHSHGVSKFSSFNNVVSLSLPLALKNNGYRTIQIGKYHVSPEPVYSFDTYIKTNNRSTVEMGNKVKEVINSKDKRPFFLYLATKRKKVHSLVSKKSTIM